MSTYFPEGIAIGKVTNLKNNGRYYSIEVKLINNLTNANNVYFVKNKDKSEIESFYK